METSLKLKDEHPSSPKQSRPPAGKNSEAAHDLITLYLQDMQRFSLLTREDEITLAKQIEQGREAQEQLKAAEIPPEKKNKLEQLIEQAKRARQHFITSNTRLVISIAKKYRNYGIPFMDLIQAGNIGLIKAVDKFDYRMGNKFSSYAVWWIRQSITRTLTKHGRTIRLPAHLNKRARKLQKTTQRMAQNLGRRPTAEEIAEETGMNLHRVHSLRKFAQRPLSLNRPAGKDGASELGNLIEDKKTPSPSQHVEEQMLQQDIQDILKTLTKKEAHILALRYGLGDKKAHTLKELGDELNISRERVRQIERKALRKLRRPQYRKKLYSYLT